jgi:signal transduction histidine kinase
MDKERPMVIVIDDEETMRDSCGLILKKDGFRTETAENGSEGIQKVIQFKPDIVLIDLKMPGISGFDVLDQIADIDPEIIAIVITGYATVDSAVEAMRKGAYDFLPKPFTPEELRIIIKRGLERRKLKMEAEKLRLEKKFIEESFITMVSHQLRSPIVTVIQFFEVILGGIIKEEEKKTAMLSRAKNKLEGLLNLINEWLDIARMNAGNIIDQGKPFSLTKLIEKTIDFYEPLAQKNNISLKLDKTSIDKMVFGDEETLEHIFTNLISNAIKYSGSGASVKISIREDDKYIITDVSDTGIGIPKEHIPFIFDQFYRVKRSESQKQKGSGLGLSIAKKIVEAHKGKITVSSESGKGSTFTVFLPKEKNAEPVDPK